MPNRRTLILFLIPALIWGSTWYAITFQVGTVNAIFSVSYRFILAGIIFMTYCKVRGISLSFDRKQHGAIYMQSLFLFGLNYIFAYNAERFVESGLVAIMFSLIIFLNVLFGKLLLGSPVRKQVLKGAVLGLSGTALIFYPEIAAIEGESKTLIGLGLAGIAIIFASLGNIASAYNQKNELPLIPSIAIGMLYGGISMFIIGLATGELPSFDFRLPYLLSLAYLTIFGSIVAFSAYLTLIGQIGADKAAYALVVVPIIAILISIVFEDYHLTPLAAVGAVLLITGNVIALRGKE